MATAELVVSGDLVGIMSGAVSAADIISGIISSLANDLKAVVLREIDQSVKLAALVGQSPDQESLRVMLRSIQIEPVLGAETGIEVKYKDDLGHWYGMEQMPEDIANALKEVVESAMNQWFNLDMPQQVVTKAIREAT